ncbi:nucleotidyltransferase domain-containing protein [Streptacidiphilus cavernicola]|uniref:DNA polymerase beta superfamily protein n=1 Tax=Streptacidiphilus cavernicola TaxID=3342716 RepID=A0ABV6VT09_9ACTN
MAPCRRFGEALGMEILLGGVVGSTAYGLAHAGSDVDRMGMFAVPTEQLFGLHRPKESLVTTSPDRTLHEAGKALRLMLSSNPTASELLWLESYETAAPLGQELIGLRRSLHSARAVRNAYLGYADQQFRKLQGHRPEQRAKGAKHARHLVRLLRQAEQLHTTGELTLRLPDPDAVRRLGEAIAEQPERARPLLARAEAALDRPGVLPEAPDTAAADAWLRRVRRAFYR